MTGGLTQIVSYGSQDLYLTGTPEITYFRVVYRRYTNFAMDSIPLPFDDSTGFGETSNVTIPRNGDLLYKMYLQIVVPSFSYQRSNTIRYKNSVFAAQSLYNKAYENMATVLNYMAVNIEAYRQAYNVYSAENVTDTSGMYSAIQEVFGEAFDLSVPTTSSNSLTVNIVSAFLNLLNTTNTYLDTHFDISNVGMDQQAYTYAIKNPTNTDKNVLMSALNYALTQSTYVQEYFSQQLNKAKKILDDAQNPNRKFAWIKRLGHGIINYVQVSIGGNVIDKHYGQWIEIWHELTCVSTIDQKYDKMIGNIPELTTFDRTNKPSYTMNIPMQFWFCRNNGMALPLVALEYHNVDIRIKLRSVSECCYIEADEQNNPVDLDAIFDNKNINIDVSLLLEYIYLDSNERKKFAQGSHEYLIEQLQFLSIPDVDVPHQRVTLGFNHPCKELFWIIQKNSFIENPNGTQECRWDNFTSNIFKRDNPFVTTQLDLNGYTRLDRFNGNMFNYLYPYEVHTKTPNDGVNCYSFALQPEEQQPSGSCNFSRLSKAIFTFNLREELFFNDDTSNLMIFAINYNILRFINGLGGLAYI
jgi:hypothetical protein